MRLGVGVGYWRTGRPGEDQAAVVQEAERLGYASAWVAESYGSDAVSMLGWLAARTSSIRLGSAILQIPGRTPAMTAMTAATLDNLSGGRFILGLGASGPQVAEGWHGSRFDPQLRRTREYVEIVRMALRRERLSYDGEVFRLPLPGGPGKALKLTIAPVQERIPIYIAAIGPRNTALAAEIADGWLPVLFAPERADVFAGALAGASPGFDVAPAVHVRIDQDHDACRDLHRPYLALYVGGMGSRGRNFYNRLVRAYGFEAAAEEVQELFLAGRRDEAAAAVPVDLIDLVTIAGPPEVARERLRAYAEAGVGTLIVNPAGRTVEERVEQLRLVAELAP